MRLRVLMVGAAALVVAGMAAGTPRAATRGGVTTGELALQMARATGIVLPRNGADRAALQALRRSGIDLGGDPTTRVTQETLVRVGRSVGVAVSASRPDAGITSGIGQAFVQTVKGPLQAAVAAADGRGTSIVHASCQGLESRQRRKGIPASPANINAIAEPCGESIP